MEQSFRIFDFNVLNINNKINESESDEESEKINKDSNVFLIQIFGVNELGKTYSVIVEDFKPFFYVMVNDSWTINIKEQFLQHIKVKIGKYYEDSISECIIIKRKKLYGFDGGKEHKFIKLEFNSFSAFNKAKNLWYSDYSKDGRKLLEDGYIFNNTKTRLYEANIPPLLRFFHIKDISPSGWIAIPTKKILNVANKKTSCDFEFIVNQKYIIQLNEKETRVPYKICSFDIEASSSHGDFPIPVKTYKKLATNIIEYFENLKMEITPELCKNILRRIINSAFGYEQMDEIDLVYPKRKPKTKQEVEQMCEKWLAAPVRSFIKTDDFNEINTLEKMYDKLKNDEEEDTNYYKKHV